MGGTRNVFRTVCASCIALAVAAPLHAQTAIVRVDGDEGSPNPAGLGNDWEADAYKFLQDAIDRVVFLLGPGGGFADAQIWVAATSPGTPYLPDRSAASPLGSGVRNESFGLLNNATLFGGFAGGETQLSQRDPATNVTILSGDLSGDDGPAPFENNAENSFHVVITDVSSDNTAVLDGFTIRDGNANGFADPDRRGAGIFCQNDPRINNCIVIDNAAADRGGGIFCGGATPLPILTNCTITQNMATGDGGGIGLSISASPKIVNCVISDNQAVGNGGGIAKGVAQITPPNTMDLTNCLIVGNTAGQDGGGVWVVKASGVTTVNCTIADDQATRGGGYFEQSQNGNSQSKIRNCVLWGNVSPDGPQIWIDSTVDLLVDFSDVQGGEGGVGGDTSNLTWLNNIDADPEFVDPTGGDYRIPATSPTIDAGNQTVIPDDEFDVDDDGDVNEKTPDLDLNTRVRAGFVDMGAYEFFCVGDTDDDGATNVNDLIDLLLCFGLPGTGTCAEEDINGDGVVNVLDLIDLLLDFGCPVPIAGQSLEEALEDAGLTMDDWDDFMDVMQTGTQEEKDNWHCWMTHYLSCHDPFGTCNPPPPNCPGSDPFGGHRH